MEDTSEQEKWLDFSQRILDAAYSIFDKAVIPVTERGARDTRVLAATLLARTISNFRGAIELARRGMVIEARVLVRCCYENLLWIDGLCVKGEGFADSMLADEHKSALGRGQFLIEHDLIGDPAIEDRLRTQLRNIRQSLARGAFLNPKTVASGGRIDYAYLIYGQLSADAAHPSLTALGRHILRSEDNGEPAMGLDVAPVPSGAELAAT